MNIIRNLWVTSILLSVLKCATGDDIIDNTNDVLEMLNPDLQNGRADVVFLLDRSGSVGAANFEIMKGFVESLLTHVVVDANATRVAVVSYSNTPTLHLNYIEDPKTKCFFSQEMQNVVYQDSEATNIAASLEIARTVLLKTRPNVNKVVILISDGMATIGGDPVPVAERLKVDTGAKIFAFGIGRFRQSELRAMASSLKHVYNCAGFKEFKRLARKIRGDPHERTWSSNTATQNCDHLCDSPYKGQVNDPGCCDHYASCSCALLSGMHTCVCQPGYFGLSGTWGKCRQCPRGTYKSSLEPTKGCTLCPLGSTTSQEASTSLLDCHCLDGYVGDPSRNSPCSRVTCPPLQNPTNGQIVGYCDNSFESECFFTCDENYELAAGQNDVRTCQANGQWSGNMPTCQKARCENPRPLEGGWMKCDSELLVGRKCVFYCHRGHHLEGSRERVCLPNKKWSGSESRCMVVLCPAPNKLHHGKIYVCRSNQPLKYGEQCVFRCNAGFKLVGSDAIICGEHGKYTDRYDREIPVIPTCKDDTKPEITCPPSQYLKTLDRQNYAFAQWDSPIATDNSGDDVMVTLASHYQKKFPIGEHLMEYIAKDSSGLKSYCQFHIIVQDREPPQLLSCPSGLTFTTSDEGTEVDWELPKFKDNSGGYIEIVSENDNRPGDWFMTGSHDITYRATDSSGNSAVCRFKVVVHQNYCPYHAPPMNGAFICEDWMYGQFCQAQCNAAYDFVIKPADWYICNSYAEWVTMPENMPIPWPDCTRRAMPYAIRLMQNGFYYHGNCNDPEVQKAIKQSFLYHFIKKFGQKYCESEGACTLDMVNVTCGETDDTFIRKKRDISESKNVLFVQMEFLISETSTELESFFEQFKNFDWNFDEELADNLDNGGFVQITSKETYIICEPGSVRNNHECAICSPGYFHDQVNDECLCCPHGYYQENDGQTHCNPCSEGFDTTSACSNNVTECLGICPVGTYSMNGLESCISCPIGTFQNESRKTSCLKCLEGYTTSNEGSKSMNDCQMPCDMGTSSENGLSPCLSCPIGYYQDLRGQKNCIECPDNLTTKSVGSNSSDCIDYNPCSDDTLCKNGGKCILVEHKVFCECVSGFSGQHCENDVNECLNICLNGGQCVKANSSFSCKCSKEFEGEMCERKIDLCESQPCLNDGICIAQSGECLCTDGFAGPDCSIALDKCQDIVCLNGGSCIAVGESTICMCSDGYGGAFCETKIDECRDHKCDKGSCINHITGYKCNCFPGWTGKYCKEEMSSDFVLEFPQNPSLDDMVSLSGTSPLKEVTISMWIQTHSSIGPATPFSYAAVDADYGILEHLNQDDGQILDNALTISDCSGLTFYVNNEPVGTDVSIDDGFWHHLVFTWSSIKSGIWKVYKDGELASTGQNLQEKVTIPGQGHLIIGQEQDEFNGSFSPLESFSGNISRVNVWDTYFWQQNVTHLYNFKDDIPEKIFAWPNFIDGIKGDVKVIYDMKPSSM